ncbi:uncharacterized protein LOC112050332 [Bicyclus anynana]|uniref:Uncharacterized protein LOC112050332 n=1 Tax=Bicyclus anynana TaxID=110368 RepID=A0ABM3LGG1_BICAN|nr:uncharacterized protein LOC112050332 [Bicyclus anynana]
MDLQLEKLSVDIIDEDFANIFSSVHFLQAIIGRLNVNIKYGFVTAPSKLYVIYSIVVSTAAILSLIGLVLQCEYADYFIIAEPYFTMGHVFNMIVVLKTVVRDLNGVSICEFYVKLQKIDRDLNFKGGKCNKTLAIYVTILTVVLCTHIFVAILVLNLYYMNSFCPYTTFMLWPEMIAIVDMILILTIIYYVSIRVNYINVTLETFKDKPLNEVIAERRVYDKKSADEVIWNHLLNGMNSVSTVMADFIELYQYQVSKEVIRGNPGNVDTLGKANTFNNFKTMHPITFIVCHVVPPIPFNHKRPALPHHKPSF